MIIFKEEYSGESLVDVDRDITEAFRPDYNPVDEYGFQTGTFTVTVTWSANEVSE